MDSRDWRKASYSNGQGSCVEVGNDRGHVLVRDTKQAGRRDRTTLAVSVGAWRAFLGKIK